MALTLAVTFWFAPRLAALPAVAVNARRGPVAVAPGEADASATRLPALLAWANVAACLALLTCVAVIVYQLH